MKAAWESQKKSPVAAADVVWRVEPVALPPGEHLVEDELVKLLEDDSTDAKLRLTAAKHLAWLRRCKAGHKIDVACLRIGGVFLLHLPGELFVEYQLAAQKMLPDAAVLTAAYGDYGPGYIGTEDAYPQGGYEVSPRASRVAPGVESVLLKAIERVLQEE